MDYIYHYTSAESLLGMTHDPTDDEKKNIEANGYNPDYGYYLEFHASDINLMNDKSENRLLKVMTDDIPDELKPVLGFAKWLTGRVYCVSFCTESDYIPMWKIYAANNPICLKFKVDGLIDAIHKINQTPFAETDIGECTYVTEDGFKEQAENYRKELLKFNKEDVERNKDLLTRLTEIIQNSAFLKLKNFDYEKEVRLAAFETRASDYKQGRYGISLYNTIKIPLRFLEEIVIGPSANQDILEYTVSGLLKSKGYDKLKQYGVKIKVTKTNVELR